ncbi:MAG: hypothetical protein R8L53_01740 [Mariprofundales bacterium]
MKVLRLLTLLVCSMVLAFWPLSSALAKSDRVEVCHNGSSLTVDNDAEMAHLAHGDSSGACSDKQKKDKSDKDKKDKDKSDKDKADAAVTAVDLVCDCSGASTAAIADIAASDAEGKAAKDDKDLAKDDDDIAKADDDIAKADDDIAKAEADGDDDAKADAEKKKSDAEKIKSDAEELKTEHETSKAKNSKDKSDADDEKSKADDAGNVAGGTCTCPAGTPAPQGYPAGTVPGVLVPANSGMGSLLEVQGK